MTPTPGLAWSQNFLASFSLWHSQWARLGAAYPEERRCPFCAERPCMSLLPSNLHFFDVTDSRFGVLSLGSWVPLKSSMSKHWTPLYVSVTTEPSFIWCHRLQFWGVIDWRGGASEILNEQALEDSPVRLCYHRTLTPLMTLFTVLGFHRLAPGCLRNSPWPRIGRSLEECQ